VNTTDFLSIAAAICPDRNSVVFEGRRFTFAQIEERSNRLAQALVGMGVRKGSCVGIVAVNCTEHVEAYFAAAKVGGIFVPVNYRSKAEELAYMINHAGISVLFVGSRYAELAASIKAQLPSVRRMITIGLENENGYEALIAAHSPDPVYTDIADDDTTILLFTSGTTGRPKAVPLRHDAFVLYALENVEPANPDIEERTILTVPLYHVAGVQAMLPAIYGGRTIIMMHQFELKEWLETVQRERATRAMLVPTMLKWIVDDPDLGNYDLSSLKIITYGAAPMPFEVIKKAIETMPQVQFINGYGQTESASTLTTLGPGDHKIEGTEEEKEKKWKRLRSSIGKPLPDVEIRIVDDGGNQIPLCAEGEIEAKGPRIMTGYWQDEAKTSETITKDGWLRTGDRGYVDEDGYVYLTGRVDDLIIRGGENIAPAEIEEALSAHPKIDECAVIGVPDAEFGQQPFAYCVLKEGASATPEEIIEFCKTRLSSFKCPKKLVFTEELPRNPVGKLLRNELRKAYDDRKCVYVKRNN
jgi:acyl-CoA synthetase (AMP-forming)/AMP-acid ligase II